ncbi:hypothetical protein CTAYLR_008814 [Chrysophaeum taylorii]|uniref:Thioredoxin domain-containing protein n=1 Tax=Chrysophaeum taylorii TaxID=2483200 RepID=A0AAD7UBN1_9STRA|nr:hypothetical protein CTAYLR_008814 [Chrysophaeum taylorii]
MRTTLLAAWFGVVHHRRSIIPKATSLDLVGPLDPPDTARFKGKRVALYFGAGWCPACARFEPSLLAFKAALDGDIELIYVSSDMPGASRAQALGLVEAKEPDDLKRRFGVWAGREVGTFGARGRRSGVPAVVVLGEHDLQEAAFLPAEAEGPSVLNNWPLDARWS